MTKRDNWKFQYSAKDLAIAAQKKVEWHQSRFAFWSEAKEKAMEEIRAKGLTIVESAAGPTYLASNALGGIQPHIQVDPQYQARLSEAHGKVLEHDAKIREYKAWVQTLKAAGDSTLKLHHDDYQFFYGE